MKPGTHEAVRGHNTQTGGNGAFWDYFQRRRRRLTAVAEVTGVMLRLVVDPHVVGDVSGRQQLPADVTRHLLLVTDQMCTEAVPRGEGRRARLRRKRGHEHAFK